MSAKENPFLKKKQLRDHVKHTAPTTRIRINLDAMYDIVTGNYIEGMNGEYILNGGAMSITGIIGKGNSFKSTIANCLALKAMGRHPSITLGTYDTEGSFQISRMLQLAKKHPGTEGRISYLADEGQYTLVSNDVATGEEWYNNLKDYAKQRGDEVNENMGTTPFIDLTSVKPKPEKTFFPAFIILDSISEFSTNELGKKREKNDVDDAALNNIDLIGNKIKTNMVREMVNVLPRGGIYAIITGHQTDDYNLSGKPQEKKLTHGKFGMKARGVPSNFNFLTHHYWEIVRSSVLGNADNTEVKYPSTKRAQEAKDVSIKKSGKATELSLVTLVGSRNKSGLSGVPFSYVLSIRRGALWTLVFRDPLHA